MPATPRRTALAALLGLAVFAPSALAATPCARAAPRTLGESRIVNLIESFIGDDTVIAVAHDPARRTASASISDSVFRRKAGQSVAEHHEYLTTIGELTISRVIGRMRDLTAFTLDVGDDRQALMTMRYGGGPLRTEFHGGAVKGCRR